MLTLHVFFLYKDFSGITRVAKPLYSDTKGSFAGLAHFSFCPI